MAVFSLCISTEKQKSKRANSKIHEHLFTTKLGIIVPWNNNKLPQTSWFQTTEISFMLSGLEARIQNWDVSTVMLPLKALGNNLSLPELLVVVVQSLNHVRLFAAPWTIACQALLFFTISQSLFKLMSVESVMPSNHLILCCPLLILPAVFPRIRVFCNESVLHIRWPKYWSFSFSISPSNEYSGLIFFQIDWFELLAVQGTLKSLL